MSLKSNIRDYLSLNCPGLKLYRTITAYLKRGELRKAAAISAFAVIVIGSLQKRLTWSHFTLSIKDIFTQTTSIFFTTASANIFVGFVPLTGMAPTLGGIVEDADVSLWL